MADTIIKGFVVQGVSNVIDLETILYEMRGVVLKTANLQFQKLVELQVERIVDEVALNLFARPEGRSILDIAVEEVKRRIIYAEQHMQMTEYNLSIGVQVIVGKLDGEKQVILKVNAPNDIYSRRFKKIKELIPFSLDSDDIADRKGDKRQFWDDIREKYENDIPLCCSLLLNNELYFNPENLKFRSPAERAKDIAVEQSMNNLLSAYACDSQVQPAKLMEYILQVSARCTTPEIRGIIEKETACLTALLPNITFELVNKS